MCIGVGFWSFEEGKAPILNFDLNPLIKEGGHSIDSIHSTHQQLNAHGLRFIRVIEL